MHSPVLAFVVTVTGLPSLTFWPKEINYFCVLTLKRATSTNLIDARVERRSRYRVKNDVSFKIPLTLSEEPQCQKRYIRIYTPSEDSDQPQHIRAV